jgi:hypothetical protein
MLGTEMDCRQNLKRENIVLPIIGDSPPWNLLDFIQRSYALFVAESSPASVSHDSSHSKWKTRRYGAGFFSFSILVLSRFRFFAAFDLGCGL